MTKTKYWLSILTISVVLIAGSLAVSPVAIADDDDDDNEIVITGTAGNENIQVGDFLNSIQCNGCTGLTVTGPVMGPFPEDFGFSETWTINLGSGAGFDDEYRINGNGGTDFIQYLSVTSDNDKVEIENTAGILNVDIIDGPGDDEYVVKGITGDIVKYEDGLGDDVFEFEG